MNKVLTFFIAYKKLFFLVLIVLFVNEIKAQFTPQYKDTIWDVNHGSAIWGDYDNDGALDFVLHGYSNGSNVTEVYRNYLFDTTWRNTKFYRQTAIGDSILSITNGSVAWGDYNNDGYLDLLVAGKSDSGYVTRIFKNLGNNYFKRQYKIYLKGVTDCSVAWGDYNNDGKLDILLSGYAKKDSFITKIYRNNGNNTFTEQPTISLTGVNYSSVAWGDYNNDGFLDFILTGYDGRKNQSITKIYKNNGQGNFTEQTNISLPGIQYGSVAWGDYNNDGFLDILLTGYAAPNIISKVYKNNGDGTFSEQTNISLLGVAHSSAVWGDYDNDGLADILLTGISAAGNKSVLYKNNGDGTFVQADTLVGVKYGSANWGDANNDGRLDILLTGYVNADSISHGRFLRNTGNFPTNTPPGAPSGLTSNTTFDRVNFSWNKATDAQTPQDGLSYNIRVGTKPGGYDVVSPMASSDSGFRRIVANGFIQSTQYSLNSLPEGQYYWSVQAIDNGFKGGAWANENTFTIQAIQASKIIDTSKTVNSCKINWTRGNGDNCIVFMAKGNRKDSLYYPYDDSTYSANPVFQKGSQIDTSGWYCVYNGTGSNTTVTGLEDGTLYTVFVLEYSNNSGLRLYNKSRSFGYDTIIHTVNVLKELKNSKLTGVKYGSAAFGDYNNDGNLDILLTGKTANITNIAKIYKNRGDGTFTDTTGISLNGVSYSSVAWGDYNNDGNIDILLTGWVGSSPVSKVYKNNGDGTFSEQTGISLTPVYKGSVAWADFDNDGLIDIFICGWTGTTAISKIYKNNGDNTFTEQPTAFITGVYNGSVAIADYNGDGYADFLLSGSDNGSNAVLKVYKNNGGNWYFTEQTQLSLTGIMYGSVSWGDYNNDGKLDILASGWTGNDAQTKLYENMGDTTFVVQSDTLPGIFYGSALFADFNNDGFSDIILAGNGYSRLFQNSGNNSFIEQSRSVDSIVQVFNGCVALADFIGNDRKLDFLITGDTINNYVSTLYENYGANTIDTLPQPVHLKCSLNGNSTVLTWDKLTSQLPANSCSYNVRIGKGPNGADVVNPESFVGNGTRKVVGMGNAWVNNNFIINNLSTGTYYWSVQAIDNAFNGGSWAAEQSFTVVPTGISKKINNLVVMFPNPAHQYFTLSREKRELANITVYDLNGKALLSKQIDGKEETINISQLSTGLYIVKFQSAASTKMFKLMVE